MNEFTQARKLLQDEERAKARHEEEVNRKCDWNDPEDVAAFRSWQRAKVRLLRIKEAVGSGMKCPECNEIQLDPSRWVIVPNRVCCRSCFFRSSFNGDPIHDGQGFVGATLFSNPKIRLSQNGDALVRARNLVGVSQREFALRAGWSRAKQRRIEDEDVKTVDIEDAEVILTVLIEAGVETDDLLPELTYPEVKE